MSQFSKNEQINVPSIQIDKNVITYANSFICTDNISLITISPIPPNNTWVGAIILGILGICTVSMDGIGIIPLIIAIIWFGLVMKYNNERGKNLAISLNSGATLYFNCKDVEFLNTVVNTMLNSIKDKNKSTYSISFDKCTINDGVLKESTLINS